MELKWREFENLQQRESPVTSYTREFSSLSRYAPEAINTEEKKMKRFMKVLQPYMKMQTRLVKSKKFQELVDIAITLEDDYKFVKEERIRKARTELQRFQNRKAPPNLQFKPRFRTYPNPNPKPCPNQNTNPPNHGNQNRNTEVFCRSCGMKGHFVAECR
jgi:hypothetical protein